MLALYVVLGNSVGGRLVLRAAADTMETTRSMGNCAELTANEKYVYCLARRMPR